MVNTEQGTEQGTTECPNTTKLLELLPKNAVEAIMQEVRKTAASDFETINALGWKPVGQRIVYGYEAALGFCNAASACGKVEAMVKKLKRAKKWTEDTYTNAFESIMVDVLINRLKNGKA